MKLKAVNNLILRICNSKGVDTLAMTEGDVIEFEGSIEEVRGADRIPRRLFRGKGKDKEVEFLIPEGLREDNKSITRKYFIVDTKEGDFDFIKAHNFKEAKELSSMKGYGDVRDTELTGNFRESLGIALYDMKIEAARLRPLTTTNSEG